MTKTILVTGGLGYIGQHIVIQLLENNYNVVVVDNTPNQMIIKNIEIVSNKTFCYYPYDINNFHQLVEVFCKNKIDKVIHLAALKSIPESLGEPVDYYQTNVAGTINLLKVMVLHNVNTIVFSSTAAVYASSKFLLTEESPVNPTNPYSKSKMMIETILKDVHHSHTLNVIVLRYFNPIGNDASGLFIDIKGTNIMPMICKSINNNETLTIYTHNEARIVNDCTTIRDYIHVVDLAEAHLNVLNLEGYHLYNVGTGEGTTTLRLVQTMEQVLNQKINYTMGPPRLGDNYMTVCSNEKMKKELGWVPKFDILKMCEDVKSSLDYYQFANAIN